MERRTTTGCPDCGAKLQGQVSASGVLVCSYCGAISDLRKLLPGDGPALICEADFSRPDWGGWRHGSAFQGAIENGSWVLSHPADPQNHPLLVAPGSYDNFDLQVTFKFTSSHTRDAFFVRGRGSSQGAMIAKIWHSGQVELDWQQPEHQWQTAIAQMPCPSEQVFGWRTLRWKAHGPNHRIFLDGTLVVSAAHSAILGAGYLDLRLQVQQSPVTLEIARLSLFDVTD